MIVYLIRHGETIANVEKKFAGIWDVELTENGIQQGIQAGLKLKDIQFEAVYCSDLQRAQKTAEKITAHHSIELIPLSSLREMNFGIWEHKKMSEIRNSDAELLSQWFADFENFIVPGGESVKEMFERVTTAYKSIIEPYSLDSDINIAIIAHGGVIQALLSFLCFGDCSGYWKFRIDNCGINKIEYAMGYPVIQAINQ